MTNRLAHETSPYLLQHKDNPVDWYPWGEDALAKARSEQKPILLSIGYAACHWCHVMEHESFEDDETAAIMNERFVPIKVDREERPDLDAVYMEAVQAMTGQGGWPMTVFLTPEGAPFYGGTYFPKEDRHGLPSFKRLLVAVADTWDARRSEVETQGRRLTEQLELQTRLESSEEPITGELLDRAVAGLQTAFDPEYGGFGTAPKFPQAMTIDFLLRMMLKGSEPAAAMAARTLDAMAAGGMFDQIAGGFARYSVDRYWLVPHFEKMLYDNAQLLRTYARSYAETKSEHHRDVAEMTVAWLFGEMRDQRGGFYSSLDADSEGEEGKFYVFSLDEVRAATGDDFDAAVRMYGLSEGGNFEGKSIPVFAARLEDRARAERVRKALLGIRSERVRPGTDDKVLAAWNGLAAAALAEAGVLLGRADWVHAAEEAMRFVLGEMIVDGRLMRSYRDGVVKHLAYCEDYAFVVEACLDLYQATFDPDWLTHSRRLADDAIRLFADDEGGGFFTTGSDAERLVRRPKDVIDNALPSANSVMALELQRLARLTGDRDYENRALSCLRLVGDAAGRSPTAFGHLLSAIDFYVSDGREVAIVGEQGSDELLAVVRDGFRPNDVVAFTREPTESVPLLRGREPLDGRAAAYVCRYGTCDLPTDDADALRRQLEPQ